MIDDHFARMAVKRILTISISARANDAAKIASQRPLCDDGGKPRRRRSDRRHNVGNVLMVTSTRPTRRQDVH